MRALPMPAEMGTTKNQCVLSKLCIYQGTKIIRYALARMWILDKPMILLIYGFAKANSVCIKAE